MAFGREQNEQSRVQYNETSVMYRVSRANFTDYRVLQRMQEVWLAAPKDSRPVCRSTLLSHDLGDGSLGDDHDGGLDVASGEIGVDATVNDVLQKISEDLEMIRRSTYQVVSAVNLGVEVDNGGTVVKTAVSTQAGGSNEVVATGVLLNQGRNIGGLDERVAGASGQELVQHFTDEAGGSALVGLGGQVGLLGEVSGLGLVEAESSAGCKTVSHVDLDGEDALRVRGARTLEEAGVSILTLAAGEPDELVLAFGQVSRLVLLICLDALNSSSVKDALGVERSKGLVGLKGDGEDGVVQETLADRQIDPLVTRRNVDTALDSGLDLSSSSDTTVPQDARAGEGTGSEDDATVGLDGNDLGRVDTSVGLELDTSDLATVTDDADDLRFSAKLEVGALSSKRQVSAKRSGAELVLNVPGRVTVDLVLRVGLLDHVDGREPESAEHLRERVVKTLRVTLAIRGWESGASVAAVEALRSSLDVAPLPANGPFVVKVVVGRVDEDHVVDRGTSTQHASGSGGSVVADVLGPKVRAANVGRKARNIDLSELVVPGKSLVRASFDGRSHTTLEKEDRVVGCREAFSGNETRRTTADDDVVVLSSGSKAGDAEPSCNGLELHVSEDFRSTEID